jgi:hypothetical protein
MLNQLPKSLWRRRYYQLSAQLVDPSALLIPRCFSVRQGQQRRHAF